ncbi:unnamed protein product [Symbiodinium necroappetens]|uniref:Uncharacterized protein n=1 Tax=Symbiodinium necroappetens TaxID=1628268 RepID=A0A812SRV0_9DINO|nr:unnamed protein product [Symbiodinium necroappetens]
MLLIASYIAEPPVCLFQFGGFMRKVWPEHWFHVRTDALGTTSKLDASAVCLHASSHVECCLLEAAAESTRKLAAWTSFSIRQRSTIPLPMSGLPFLPCQPVGTVLVLALWTAKCTSLVACNLTGKLSLQGRDLVWPQPTSSDFQVQGFLAKAAMVEFGFETAHSVSARGLVAARYIKQILLQRRPRS